MDKSNPLDEKYKHVQERLATFTEWQLATLEKMDSARRTLKNERKRQLDICTRMAVTCFEHGLKGWDLSYRGWNCGRLAEMAEHGIDAYFLGLRGRSVK